MPIPHEQIQHLLDQHTDGIRRLAMDQQPVLIEMHKVQALQLVGLLQLCLRHPAMRSSTDPAAMLARGIIGQLKEKIGHEADGLIGQIIEHGENPDFDQEIPRA